MNIEIRVDRRTELLGVMLLLSNYNKNFSHLISEMPFNKEYRQNIFNHFEKFKQHKTMLLFNDIIEKLNFSYDAPIRLFLQLKEDYSFDSYNEYPFKNRLKKSQLVKDFLQELPTFVKDTNFEEYYISNLTFYNKIIKESYELIDIKNIEGFLKDFYKEEFKNISFNINLLPFATRGHYAAQIGNEFYANMCPKSFETERMQFHFKNEPEMMYIHEFSHSVINPLADKYLNIDKGFFSDIEKEMRKDAYTDDYTIMVEHIIRAIEYEFLNNYYKYKSEKNSNMWLVQMLDRGYKYLPLMIQLMDKYYLNKDKYKNFEQFFPVLIDSFCKEKNNLKINNL